MRMISILTTGMTLVALTGARADCVPPEDVEIPDGTVSTYEEMRDSQTFVKEYMADMEAYLECLDRQRTEPETVSRQDAGDPDSASEEAHLQRRMEAINAMETMATKFNEQVRAYKLANP